MLLPLTFSLHFRPLDRFKKIKFSLKKKKNRLLFTKCITWPHWNPNHFLLQLQRPPRTPTTTGRPTTSTWPPTPTSCRCGRSCASSGSGPRSTASGGRCPSWPSSPSSPRSCGPRTRTAASTPCASRSPSIWSAANTPEPWPPAPSFLWPFSGFQPCPLFRVKYK